MIFFVKYFFTFRWYFTQSSRKWFWKANSNSSYYVASYIIW